MKRLFKVSVPKHTYDQYDSLICAAEDELEAAHTHPYGYKWDEYAKKWCYVVEYTREYTKFREKRFEDFDHGVWPGTPYTVKVEEIDLSEVESGPLHLSFNAG